MKFLLHRLVTASEMEAYFATEMPEHVKDVHMLIRAFDRNGDGKMHLWEIGDMVKAKEAGDIKERYMWKVLDKDGSGCHTKDEYHTVMMCMGMGPDLVEKYMIEDYAKYDYDEDGHLRYNEFKVSFKAKVPCLKFTTFSEFIGDMFLPLFF